MVRPVAALALMRERIAAARPGGAWAPVFEAIDPDGFVLERVGLDPETYALVEELPEGWSPVSLTGVLDGADRETKPLAAALGGRAHGYRWDRADGLTQHWYPQGVTGSADAGASEPAPDRGVHLVSWYSKRGHGVRLSFVDHAAGRYRHALCVRPTGGGSFAPVKVHAGGIVWIDGLVYVADTHRGLRVFDTSRMRHVPERGREDTHGHAYVVPQVGAYRSTGAELTFSFASLDRCDPAALMAGEYSKAPGGRLVRWPIDVSSGLLSGATATAAYRVPIDRVQGATTIAGRLVASSSRRGGRLYVGLPGERSRRHAWWPFLPEDLYFSGDTEELISLTEGPGRRMVFGVPSAELGLESTPINSQAGARATQRPPGP